MSSRRNFHRPFAFVVASLFAGCSTISLKYRATVTTDDGAVSQVEYSENQSILGHSIACAGTVWAAGGWCWYFALIPTTAQKDALAENASILIREKMASRPFKTSGTIVTHQGFTSLAGPIPAAPFLSLTPGQGVAEVSDLGQPPENDRSNYATVDVVWSKGWGGVQQASGSTPVAYTPCPTLHVTHPDGNKGEAPEWRNLCARIASRYDVLFASEKNAACHNLSLEFLSRAMTGTDQFRKFLVVRSTAKDLEGQLTATLTSSHAEISQETVTALCRAVFAHIKSKDRAARYVDVSTAFESDPSDREEVANEAFAAGRKLGPKTSGGVVALPPTPEISPWLAIATPKLPWIPDRFFLEAGWGALDTVISRIRYMTTHYWMDSNLGTLDYHGAIGYRPATRSSGRGCRWKAHIQPGQPTPEREKLERAIVSRLWTCVEIPNGELELQYTQYSALSVCYNPRGRVRHGSFIALKW